MITETLSETAVYNRGYNVTPKPFGATVSDSALKVVFLTTLYVDVKEPAVQYILATKKLNLMPTRSQCARDYARSVFVCRDKIESNLQSQMYVERAPTWWSPASSGINIIAPSNELSNQLFSK